MSPDHEFPDTRWSVVLQAQGTESAVRNRALELICRTYWLPEYAFARSQGLSPPDAEDLTQNLLSDLLDRQAFERVTAEKGEGEDVARHWIDPVLALAGKVSARRSAYRRRRNDSCYRNCPGSTFSYLAPAEGIDPATHDPDVHEAFFLPEFDDSRWETGIDHGNGFGYGSPVDVEWPTPAEENRKTTYFRHRFTVEEPMTDVRFRAQMDDGYIAYLDGAERFGRINVESGEAERFDLIARSSHGWLHENIASTCSLRYYPGWLDIGHKHYSKGDEECELMHGLILLKLDEREAYTRHCRMMLDQYENTDDRVDISAAAKLLFIDPRSSNSDLLSRAVAAARKAKAIGPENAWTLLCSGLAEFRAGEHPQAIALLNEIRSPQPSCRSAEFATLAMAKSALGDAESAKCQIVETQETLIELDIIWFIQLIAEMLCEEAIQLIEGQ